MEQNGDENIGNGISRKDFLKRAGATGAAVLLTTAHRFHSECCFFFHRVSVRVSRHSSKNRSIDNINLLNCVINVLHIWEA